MAAPARDMAATPNAADAAGTVTHLHDQVLLLSNAIALGATLVGHLVVMCLVFCGGRPMARPFASKLLAYSSLAGALWWGQNLPQVLVVYLGGKVSNACYLLGVSTHFFMAATVMWACALAFRVLQVLRHVPSYRVEVSHVAPRVAQNARKALARLASRSLRDDDDESSSRSASATQPLLWNTAREPVAAASGAATAGATTSARATAPSSSDGHAAPASAMAIPIKVPAAVRVGNTDVLVAAEGSPAGAAAAVHPSDAPEAAATDDAGKWTAAGGNRTVTAPEPGATATRSPKLPSSPQLAAAAAAAHAAHATASSTSATMRKSPMSASPLDGRGVARLSPAGSVTPQQPAKQKPPRATEWQYHVFVWLCAAGLTLMFNALGSRVHADRFGTCHLAADDDLTTILSFMLTPAAVCFVVIVYVYAALKGACSPEPLQAKAKHAMRASRYLVIFVLVWLPVFVANVAYFHQTNPRWLIWGKATLFPLQGVFNMVVMLAADRRKIAAVYCPGCKRCCRGSRHSAGKDGFEGMGDDDGGAWESALDGSSAADVAGDTGEDDTEYNSGLSGTDSYVSYYSRATSNVGAAGGGGGGGEMHAPGDERFDTSPNASGWA